MYPTHAGPIGCTILMLWPHKYKVGQIDLILIFHQNLINSPEILEILCVSHTHTHTHIYIYIRDKPNKSLANKDSQTDDSQMSLLIV